MVVQHLENRLALSSVNPSEQLHEFQIVHALITQCRKQATADENPRNNHNGCENQMPVMQRKCSKEERSFVDTIRQTFNALAQATNPSLCAKQNVSSNPVRFASTVKNIISQFSRQSHHSPLCLATPPEASTTKPNSPRRNSTTRKQSSPPPHKGTSSNKDTSSSKPRPISPNLSEPSTSNGLTSGCKTEKPAVLRPSPPNTIATKPKTRSVRAKNAHRLVRHESAPIPVPAASQSTVPKTTVSVRRSKSDAVCYTSYIKQTRRNTDSNVQTKVLHFENCCKGKGQAAMCVECRKHNLEDEVTTPPQCSSSLPRIESVRPKQEKYLGALSYHRPSTITQTSNANAISGTPNVTSLPPIDSAVTLDENTPPQTAVRPKVVVCPGGTFFGASDTPQPTLPSPSPHSDSVDAPIEVMDNVECEKSPDLATMDEPMCSIDIQCSQNKRKHSISEDEPMQSKRESREGAVGNTINATVVIKNELCVDASTVQVNGIASENHAVKMDTESSKFGAEAINEHIVRHTPSETDNLYILLSNDKTGAENASRIDSNTGNASDSVRLDGDVKLSVTYDSSDNVDSSSSSGESCLSPRQEYLARQSGRSPLSRTPSTRYQKMRRKLKKLITRSRSCPEVPQPVIQSQSDAERYFLENIRIPTPIFKLSKDSFAIKRQQLSMHFDQNQDWMSRLPDHVLVLIFSYMDTRSLAALKSVCTDFEFVIDSYDIRATDSMWVEDKRYLEDPCRFCRKKFIPGDMSMCRYHAKSYHCDLPYGRSYWMCCFKIERSAPGCRTGIHNNRWCSSPPLHK